MPRWRLDELKKQLFKASRWVPTQVETTYLNDVMDWLDTIDIHVQKQHGLECEPW